MPPSPMGGIGSPRPNVPFGRLVVIVWAVTLVHAPAASAQLFGSITGTKWRDTNQNGTRDPLETGLSGWVIQLAQPHGPVVAQATTDSVGLYVFENVQFGMWEVREVLQAGWTQSFPPPPGFWIVDVNPGLPNLTGVDFGNWTTGQCQLEYEWRRGPPITITKPLDYWPTDAMLEKMRPGDVIALTILAEDSDWLVQRCKDCGTEVQGEVQRKWGPYPDRVKYDWRLLSDDPGELILPPGLVANTVFYRIPLCGWKDPIASQTATVTVEVKNDPDGKKVVDPPILGTSISFNMVMDCSSTPGWIKVKVVKSDGTPGTEEVVTEHTTGTCIPQSPAWQPLSPISYSEIAIKEPPDLCPDYVLLLSVDASDEDEAELKCLDPSPLCAVKKELITTGDLIRYSWSLVSGSGEFPLGTSGPVVAFRRSRSQNAVVRCNLIEDSGTQATDPPQQTNTRTNFKAKKAKAFVAVGDAETWYGARIIDLERAAQTATAEYEAAGYEVEENLSANINDVTNALKTACYQAMWVGGHGQQVSGHGNVYLNTPPAGNAFNQSSIGATSRITWSCFQHPFIRDLVIMGCNTYDADWVTRLVCGQAFSFNYTMVGNIVGQVLGRNPYIWERDNHSPPSPHNLSAP